MTSHLCDKELPCSTHFTIFIWAFGIIATVLSGMVYAIIDNRNRAVDEHKLMITAGTAGDESVRVELDKDYAEIIQRLARIESKLEIPSKTFGGG